MTGYHIQEVVHTEPRQHTTWDVGCYDLETEKFVGLRSFDDPDAAVAFLH